MQFVRQKYISFERNQPHYLRHRLFVATLMCRLETITMFEHYILEMCRHHCHFYKILVNYLEYHYRYF